MSASPDHTMQTDAPAPETEEAKRARLKWEAERIEEARASIRAGRVVSHEAVKAWVDSWGTDHELPRPRPGS